MMQLGARLRQLRKQHRLTLVDLGEQTKLSVSFLSEIEREQTNPSLETLEKIGKCYGLTVNQLLEGVDLGGTGSNITYPPGLAVFLNEARSSPDFDESVVELMLKVEQRSVRRAETVEDWKRFYYSLKTIIGG